MLEEKAAFFERGSLMQKAIQKNQEKIKEHDVKLTDKQAQIMGKRAEQRIKQIYRTAKILIEKKKMKVHEFDEI